MKIRKILLTTVAALCLMAVTVAGTMAYLVSTTQTVENTFTVGKVNITLDEAEVDEYGNPTTPAKRVKKNSYKLMPGHTYTKDPTIHIGEDTEESYLRIVVTVTNAENTDKYLAGGITTLLPAFSFDAEYTENSEKDWYCVSNELSGNTRTYIFNYYDTITYDKTANSTKNDIVIFDKVVVPTSLDNTAIEALNDTKLSIVAHAIQTDGFKAENGKTAVENAWAAFDTQQANKQ